MTDNVQIKELEYEKIIIKLLFYREDLRQVILPHLKVDIFKDENNRYIVSKIFEFHNQYKSFPKSADLLGMLDIERHEYIKTFKDIDINSFTKEFLENEIQKFIKNRLFYNVITKYAENLSKGQELDLSQIQKVSTFYFDNSVGLDFFEDAEFLYDSLVNGEEFVKTGLSSFNSFLGGGFVKKGLTMFLAGTGVGKSIFMCHFAADLARRKVKSLYISLEMSEAKIARRIDLNILELDRVDMNNLTKEKYLQLKAEAKRKYGNNIIVKKYAPHEFSTNNLRNLLRELKEKKNFVPEVVFVDYLGLMRPNFVGKDSNEATNLKRASEELFGLGGDMDMAMVTAMQFNRDGVRSETAGMNKIAGSIGTAFTADEVITIKQGDDLKAEGKYKLVKEKSREGISGTTIYLKINYDRMTLTDCEEVSTLSPNDSSTHPVVDVDISSKMESLEI